MDDLEQENTPEATATKQDNPAHQTTMHRTNDETTDSWGWQLNVSNFRFI